MSANDEAAKYRNQRNEALKNVEALKALLDVAKVDAAVVATAQSLLGSNEIVVENGKASGFTVTEQQKDVLTKLVGKQEQKPEPPEKKDPPKEDAVVEAVKAVLKEMGVEGKSSEATKVPGAPTPSEGKPSPGGGLTREGIQAMTPEQINANWKSISQGLENGSLSPTPQ